MCHRGEYQRTPTKQIFNITQSRRAIHCVNIIANSRQPRVSIKQGLKTEGISQTWETFM